MYIDYFLKVFKENINKNAIIWRNKEYSYKWLIDRYFFWIRELEKKNVGNSSVIVIDADFSPNAIALLLALIKNNAIIVPLTESVGSKKESFIEIAEGEKVITIDKNDKVKFNILNTISNHNIYAKLKKRNHPGLVLFSSGSTGYNKASVHDMTYLLEKFLVKRHSLTTITFLLYDHIGGFNTLFYTLSNGGLIVTAQKRSPEAILKLVETYNVELLPTTPTFLNLILISESYKFYNLSSLKIITYGTEPMPQSTLIRLNEILPNVKFTQTYGLSEVGILRSKSKSSKSLWVKVGGEGYQTRVVDGLLEIKSKSSMLGYLNAPSPFSDDGWFKTGDSVITDGEYLKILGRATEIINVGGEKVYPQEVENTILQHPEVIDIVVYKKRNPIVGNMVCAKIRFIHNNYDKYHAGKIIKEYCQGRIEKYKIPVKIELIEEDIHSSRFKKKRI